MFKVPLENPFGTKLCNDDFVVTLEKYSKGIVIVDWILPNLSPSAIFQKMLLSTKISLKILASMGNFRLMELVNPYAVGN